MNQTHTPHTTLQIAATMLDLLTPAPYLSKGHDYWMPTTSDARVRAVLHHLGVPPEMVREVEQQRFSSVSIVAGCIFVWNDRQGDSGWVAFVPLDVWRATFPGRRKGKKRVRH